MLSFLYPLGLEKELAGCLAALNIGVCPSCIGEWVDFVDADVDLARLDEIKQLGRILFQIFPRRNVAIDNGAHKPNVLGSQSKDTKRIHGAGLTMLVFFIVTGRTIRVLTAFPNEIRFPLRAIISRSASKVSLPIPSKMASMP